jgi:hypothetical protein
MCNYLFVAADHPLPTLAWNEESPCVYVTEASDPELAAVRHWLTKPFIYDIGSHLGCGCPFSCEPNWDNPSEDDLREWSENRRDFGQLATYLEGAIALAGPVEVYNGFDYWEPPLQRRSISIRDLRGDRFVFDERELVTVQGSTIAAG